jgi:hypothetical protein
MLLGSGNTNSVSEKAALANTNKKAVIIFFITA